MVGGKPKPDGSPWKTFTSKIHPPLPRTTRETQQLQGILSESFRRQLDKRYPPPNPKKWQPPEPQPQPQLQPKHEPQHEAQHATTSRPRPRSPAATDNHFSSILRHPLFNNAQSSSRAKVPAHGKRSVGHGAAPRLSKNPADVMTDAMAAGSADVHTFYTCLRADWAELEGLSEADVREHLRTSRFGYIAVSWFAAADSGSKLRALDHPSLVRFVIPYLCSAGYQETVMTWLEELLQDRPTATVPYAKPIFQKVLNTLVSCEIHHGDGIGSVLQLFVRICSAKSLAESPGDAGRIADISWVQRGARYLIKWISSHNAKSDVSPVSPQLFDQFFSLFDRFENHFTYKCILALYHPTHPDPGFAIQFIASCPPENTKPDQRLNSPVSRMCLRAAEVCIQQDSDADAQRFLTYVQHMATRKTSWSDAQLRNRKSVVSEVISRLDPAFS